MINFTFCKSIIITMVLLIASTINVAAQASYVDCANLVTNNPLYIYGEGQDRDLENARMLSVSDLLDKIQISIFSITTFREREEITIEDTTYESDFEQQYKSFTGLTLQGINRCTGGSSKSWKILSYISRESLDKSFEIRKLKIREFIKFGTLALERGDLGETLRNYYWGYLLSKVYPDTVHLELSGQIGSYYPEIAIANMIETLINDIKIFVGNPYQDGLDVMVPLQITYNSKPINRLSMSYYSGSGTEYALIEKGVGDIPLYDEIESKSRILPVKIEYVYEGGLISDSEITGLYDIFKGDKFDNVKYIEINFPWLNSDETRSEEDNETDSFSLTDIPEAILVLSQLKETSNFLELLEQYSKLKILRYGKRIDFSNVKGCYVAIADLSSIKEILYFEGNIFIGIHSGNMYQNLKSHFKGKRTIWMKEII